jgi:hypothetical protein
MERYVSDRSHREVYRHPMDSYHLISAEERHRITMARQ